MSSRSRHDEDSAMFFDVERSRVHKIPECVVRRSQSLIWSSRTRDDLLHYLTYDQVSGNSGKGLTMHTYQGHSSLLAETVGSHRPSEVERPKDISNINGDNEAERHILTKISL